MKKKITYFFGAGASFHSLPLLATMSERMKLFSTYLKIAKKKNFIKHEFTDQFIEDLDKLIRAEKESTSIDAYAKYLFDQNEHLELLHLKAILSAYLIFEQLIKPDDFRVFLDENEENEGGNDLEEMIACHLDPRYRTFWGDYISNGSRKPPENVRVLSWNYDMQLEFSFSNLMQCSLEMTQQELQVSPSKQTNVSTDNFCTLKLNGTAGLINYYGETKPKNLFDLRIHKLNNENLDYLINLLHENYHRSFSRPVFSFAWENEREAYQTRKLAKEVIRTTDILIIVGYSFPSFNREIDRELFSNGQNLEKIYYQAPDSEIDYLKIQLEGVNAELLDKVIPIPNLRTFFIPPEK